MANSANVILITIDTVRPDFLGCYGRLPTPSPTIDKIAAQATVFSQAISNGSYTAAAFPAILSSTYASMYGGPFAEVGRRRPYLGRLLKDAGFRTGGFTSNPLVGSASGYDTGFDFFAEPRPIKEGSWTKWRGMQHLLRQSWFQRGLQFFGNDGHPPRVYVKGNIVTDSALDWLAALDLRDGKFFLWVHFMDAHWPYHTYESMNSPQDYAQGWRDMLIMYRAYHAQHPGKAAMDRAIKLYNQGIFYMDGQIGRLISELQKMDTFEKSLVIIAADHGEEFFEHGVWQHGASRQMYDELLRVPLIIKFPFQDERIDVTQQVSLLDLAPTILDVTSCPPEPSMEGRSLLPYQSEQKLPDKPIISEMVAQDWYCAAVRTENFKYIYDERVENSAEVYDLLSDPGEKHNIFPTAKGDVELLEETLFKHLERVQQDSNRDDGGRWAYDEEITNRLRSLGYIE